MKTILINIIIRLFKGRYYSISGNTGTLMKVAEIAEKCGYKVFLSRERGDNHIIFYSDMDYSWCNHSGYSAFAFKL